MYPVTALDMYELTLEILNKQNTTSVTPEEWNVWANTATLEHCLFLYEKYQNDQAITDKLGPIIVDPAPISNTGVAAPNQEIFVLPSDYLRMLRIGIKLNYVNDPCFANGPGTEYVSATLLTDDQYGVIDDNPYRKAKSKNLYYYHKNGGLNIAIKTGGSSYGLEAEIRYLKYPKKIDVTLSPGTGDSELPSDVKNDICHIIARKIIEAIESGRYQTIAGEANSVINN